MLRSPWIAMAMGFAVAVALWVVRSGRGDPPTGAGGDAEDQAAVPFDAPRGVASPAGQRPAPRAAAPPAARLAPRAQRPDERDSAYRARMRLLDQLQARAADLDTEGRARAWAVLADVQDSYGDPEQTCALRGEAQADYDQAQCLDQLLEVLAHEARDRLDDELGSGAARFDEGFLRAVLISRPLGLFKR